jgi:hypothetical protein
MKQRWLPRPALARRNAGKILVGLAVLGILLVTVFLHEERTLPNPRRVDHGRINYLRLKMTEAEVRALMGEPDRATKGRYLLTGSYQMGILHYTLDDGRGWIIILDEQGRLVAAGEPEKGQRVKDNPRLNAVKEAFSGR